MRSSTLRMAIGALVTLAAVACTNSHLPPPPQVPFTSYDQAPAYRLDAGDVLDLRFPHNPELNEQLVVGPDGRVSALYAADVVAAGRTLDEVSSDLKRKYSTQLVDAALSLSLRSYTGTKVYVAGEVATPGEFVATGPITALQAITRAGGFKTTASYSLIVLVRRDPDGHPKIYGINVRDVMSGDGPATEDVRLQAYDILYVPRTPLEEVSQVMEQVRNAVPFNFGFTYILP